jgi:hypothetical protein
MVISAQHRTRDLESRSWRANSLSFQTYPHFIRQVVRVHRQHAVAMGGIYVGITL